MNTFFTFDKDSQYGFLVIRDTTTYPVTLAGASFTRDQLAIIRIVSDDAFSADFNSDLTNPGSGTDAAEWLNDMSGGMTYTAKCYWVYKWETGNNRKITIPQFTMVYHEGRFYVYLTAGTLGKTDVCVDPGTDPAVWAYIAEDETVTIDGVTYTDIDDEDLYDICEKCFTTEENPLSTFENAETVECPEFSVDQIDCHQWRLNASDSCTISSVTLLDYNMTELDSVSDRNLIDLSEYGDGYYILKIDYTQRGVSTIGYLPIPDMCDARSCHAALLKRLICSCDDPCEYFCDESNVTRWSDLNSLLNLVENTEKMIYLDKYKFLGVFTMDQERQNFETEIGMMIDKVKIITERCGLCDESDTNNVECP